MTAPGETGGKEKSRNRACKKGFPGKKPDMLPNAQTKKAAGTPFKEVFYKRRESLKLTMTWTW